MTSYDYDMSIGFGLSAIGACKQVNGKHELTRLFWLLASIIHRRPPHLLARSRTRERIVAAFSFACTGGWTMGGWSGDRRELERCKCDVDRAEESWEVGWVPVDRRCFFTRFRHDQANTSPLLPNSRTLSTARPGALVVLTDLTSRFPLI